MEAREEAEIKNDEERVIDQTLPSDEFQEELLKTQANGTEVISDPIDEEIGFQRVQGLLEEQKDSPVEDVMEWDEIKVIFLANGIDMDAEDELQRASEEEAEEETTIWEEEAEMGKGRNRVLMQKRRGMLQGRW
ncbi:hypothetical protein HID58_001668 [Brassica napus]|uniref:Uncharacterized protein n=1 Tax=Brassica napus TaxID=3708 RepID=A0ABQ8EK39_BRANA|nr:hypothetical protein HID58_001668 [Brassica napus]